MVNRKTKAEAINAYIVEMDRFNIVLAVGSGELEMVTAMQSQAQDRFLGGIEFPRYTVPVNNRLTEWPELDELRHLFESDQLQGLSKSGASIAKKFNRKYNMDDEVLVNADITWK